MVYFMADPHFGHESIIRICNRPFDSVLEMNKTIIRNTNTRVQKNDTLYLLGDVAHRIPVTEANELISRLNGRKILVRGNHDKGYDPALFTEICDLANLSFDGVKMVAMHYPMEEWAGSYHGSVHVHGHQHNGPEYNLARQASGVRKYDVGVDANGFGPVSAREVLQFFGLT